MYAQGIYLGTLKEQGITESKEKKTPQVYTKWTIQQHFNGTEFVPCDECWDRSIFWAVTPKTVDFVIEKLERLGFTGTGFECFSPESPNFQDLSGVEAKLVCSHDLYQGEPRERWELARDGQKVEQAGGDVLDKLNSMFGRKLSEKFGAKRQTVSNGVSASQARKAVTAAAKGDEDIPF